MSGDDFDDYIVSCIVNDDVEFDHDEAFAGCMMVIVSVLAILGFAAAFS